MACFVVPAAEAVVTTVVEKVVKSKEEKEVKDQGEVKAVPFSRKLRWLNTMLWGGSFLLAFEHLWHGEIAPVFPFLTAAGSAEGLAIMIKEMLTTGVAMAVVVTAVWAGMVVVSNIFEKRADKVQLQNVEKES